MAANKAARKLYDLYDYVCGSNAPPSCSGLAMAAAASVVPGHQPKPCGGGTGETWRAQRRQSNGSRVKFRASADAERAAACGPFEDKGPSFLCMKCHDRVLACLATCDWSTANSSFALFSWETFFE